MASVQAWPVAICFGGPLRIIEVEVDPSLESVETCGGLLSHLTRHPCIGGFDETAAAVGELGKEKYFSGGRQPTIEEYNIVTPLDSTTRLEEDVVYALLYVCCSKPGELRVGHCAAFVAARLEDPLPPYVAASSGAATTCC